MEWFSIRTGTSVDDGARSKNTRKELGRQPRRVLSEMWFSKLQNAVMLVSAGVQSLMFKHDVQVFHEMSFIQNSQATANKAEYGMKGK